jgi:hypothetical protein
MAATGGSTSASWAAVLVNAWPVELQHGLEGEVCQLRRARECFGEGARRWCSHGGPRQPGGISRRALRRARAAAHL